MIANDDATGSTLPNDPLGAFCRHNHVALAGSGKGPLAGLTFAAKDLSTSRATAPASATRTGCAPIRRRSAPPRR